MKSKEFYKQMDDLTKDQFIELGFSKDKGTALLWQKERDDDRIFIEIRNGKYPWEEYSGGDFTINCHCCPKSSSYNEIEEAKHSVSFFDYLSEGEYSDLTQFNQKVCEKIKALDLSVFGYSSEEIEVYEELHDSACESMEYQISSNTSRVVVNPPLYYLDSDDINHWATTINHLLKIIIPAIDKDVKFSFSNIA